MSSGMRNKPRPHGGSARAKEVARRRKAEGAEGYGALSRTSPRRSRTPPQTVVWSLSCSMRIRPVPAACRCENRALPRTRHLAEKMVVRAVIEQAALGELRAPRRLAAAVG